MEETLANLKVQLTASTKGFKTQMDSVKDTLSNIQKQLRATSKSANNMGSAFDKSVKSSKDSVNTLSSSLSKMAKMLALSLSTAGIVAFGKSCANLGSDLEESWNMVSVVFSGLTDQVEDFCSKSVTMLGLTKAQAQQQLGVLGTMSKGMGMGKQQALDFSKQVMQLGTDIASFYNMSMDEVDTMLKSLYSGETEPFKRIGVDISQAGVEAYMLSQGLNKSYSELSRLEAVQMRYAYVCQQTADAQGDFSRSMGSYANQVRILQANFANLKATIGQGLIAVLTPVIGVINKVISALNALAQKFVAVMSALGFNVSGGGSTGGLGGAIGDTLDNVGGAVGGIGDALGGIGDSVGKAKGKVKDLGKEAEATAKKMKDMMGIDEINVIKKDKDTSSDGGDGGSGGSGGSGGGAGAGSGVGDVVDGLNTTSKAIDELSNKAKAVLAEILSPFKQAWANYGEWFLSKINYLKDAFGYACTSMGNFLKSVWNNGGKEFVQHMTEIGIVIAGVTAELTGDILVALGNLFNHLNPDNNPYTKAFIEAMNNLAIAVRDFVLGAESYFQLFMSSGGQAFINTCGDIVMIVGTTLAEVLTDIISVIKAFMDSWIGHTIIKTCALALDLVAGALKAVAIVMEKCHGVLSALLILWATWKFSMIIKGLGDVTTTCGDLIYKLFGLGVSIGDNISKFATWVKSVGVSALNALKSFGSALLHPVTTLKTLSSALISNITQFATWIKTTAVSAVNAVKNFAISIASGVQALAMKTAALVAEKGAMVASMVATNGLAVAQGVLNAVMNACPIILLVSLIAGLIAIIIKVGEKFGWWKAIMDVVNDALGWVGEKIGWLWDKVKSFFGWDSSESTLESDIGSVGDTANTTAGEVDMATQQMSNSFGTASSNINQYLATIGYNPTQLLADVDYATQVISEKFGLLSKSSQDYLTALANNDQATLESMKVNEGAYMEEIKAMYAGLTEEEKNQFYAKYGCIEGVNNDWLNLEGLTYDQLVAKHVAYTQNIENDENLTYQEKQRLIAEHEKAINDSYNNQLNTLKSKLNEVKNDESLSKEERVKLAQDLEKQIKELEGSKAKSAKENVNDVTKTTQEATKTQKSSVEEVTKSQKSALKEVKSSVKDTNNVIKDLGKESKSSADRIRNAFKGIGKDISNEFKKADNGVKSTFDKIYDKIRDTMNKAKNSVNSFKGTIDGFSATLHVKVPHFSMSGSFNPEKGTVPKVSVSYYAKGGIMNKATLMGMVGNHAFVGGEAGREAILPLDRNTGWMDGLASKVAGAVVSATNNNGGTTNDRPLEVNLKVGETTVGKVCINSIHKLEQQNGVEYLIG